MPSVLVTESWNCEVGGQEPWPSDVKLYQPYEVEQILLPDNANCLAVQAFLKMCDLPFSIEYKHNAEFMSPSGKVPFLKCGSYIVSELDPIVAFVSNKGKSLTNDLNSVQKSDMRAYMSLVNTVLGNAENFITWCDGATYSLITKERYGSVHPFPLNHALCYIKRRNIIKRLTAFKWADYTLDKVYEEVDQCCLTLSDRLGKNKYFFGDNISEVDALVFGHIYSILTWRTIDAGLKLAEIIRSHTRLVEHCMSIGDIANMTADITLAQPHKLYSTVTIASDFNIDSKIDEFVYSDDDYDVDESEDFTAESFPVINDRNLIYDSVFAKTQFVK